MNKANAPEGFSIQFVSKITGINPHTLRAWEKRYQAVVPERLPNGKRLYTQDNIDRLKILNDLVTLGTAISDIASLPTKKLELLNKQYTPSQLEPTQLKEKIDIEAVLKNLIMALNHYKLDIISHELEKLTESLDPRDFAFEILSPLLSLVGDKVNTGKMSIAQEHSLSAILKFHIGHILYRHISSKKTHHLNICLATPEGELHEFGIMIAALLCCHYNIHFYYLGADMPAASLAEAANQVKSKIVILGVSRATLVDSGKRLDAYTSKLRESLNPDIKMWLGGMSKIGKSHPEIELIPTLQKLDQKFSILIEK
ncbi:MAG: MerR family transcriptional regulator [Bacteriovoracaceae bacterium]